MQLGIHASKLGLLVHAVHLLYSLSCLCLKIINGSRRLFLMEEREQNKLCHLFMGDLGDESERKKAGKHYQAKHKIKALL